MAMTAQKLITLIEKAGKKPRSYSGRGMCGAECVACSVNREDDYAGLPGGYNIDSLGRGTIVYWRGVPWPQQEMTGG